MGTALLFSRTAKRSEDCLHPRSMVVANRTTYRDKGSSKSCRRTGLLACTGAGQRFSEAGGFWRWSQLFLAQAQQRCSNAWRTLIGFRPGGYELVTGARESRETIHGCL